GVLFMQKLDAARDPISQFAPRCPIDPDVPICFQTTTVVCKEFESILTIHAWHESIETHIPLIQPVVLIVGSDPVPSIHTGDPLDCTEVSNDRQLLLLVEIVADVVKEDAAMLRRVRVLYEDADG